MKKRVVLFNRTGRYAGIPQICGTTEEWHLPENLPMPLEIAPLRFNDGHEGRVRLMDRTAKSYVGYMEVVEEAA